MIATEHPLSEIITMYKRLAGMYDAGSESISARISNHVTRENFMRYVKGPDIRKVLDAGGGTGNWSVFLAQQGFEVTLLDISPDLLKIARKKFEDYDLPVKVMEGDIENTAFNEQEFDLIFAEGGVISLTPDPEKMMEELKRITKNKGYLWIDYLNLRGWALMQPELERRAILAGKDEELIYMGKNNVPFRLFSPNHFRSLLYDAGFMEVNEFGNGIITNPMMEDHLFRPESLENIKESELKMSRNYSLMGSAFHIEVLAQKVIMG